MKNKLMLLATGLLLFACQKKTETEETIIEETITDAPAPQVADAAGKQCYLKVVAKDSIIFQAERYGDSIQGIFHFKPFEKDKKISSFKGVMNGNEGTAIALSKGEGMENREQLDFKLEDGKVTIKFGEMVEGKDGVWRYKDMNNTSLEVLPVVNCE